MAGAPFEYTEDAGELKDCVSMLLLLNADTWAGGDNDKRKELLIEHIHLAMEKGVQIVCAHEFPSIIGDDDGKNRHACEFASCFTDEWTPPHLTSGSCNLYKEIAIPLKAAGVEAAWAC